MASQLQDLPPEILIHILSCLDVRNLLQCESVSKVLCDIITGSPQLQYNMELEIAGLVDKPSVLLPVTERLERLKTHQLRMKDPSRRTDRPIIQWPQKPHSGNVELSGDLFFVPCTTAPGDSFVLFDAVDVGHLRSPISDGDDPIRWWTIRTPRPFHTLFADPSQGIAALADRRYRDTLQVISISSGKSVVDGDSLGVPMPDSEPWWTPTQVQIHGDLLANGFILGFDVCGATIVGWKDGVVRVCFKFPEGVGTAILLVSNTTFLATSQTEHEYGLRMYSFEEPAGAGPSDPTHIATFLFPPLYPGMGARVTLKGPCRGAYSSKTDQQPFTTSKGASVITAAFPTISSPGSFRGAYKIFIHASAFTSSQVTQIRAQGARPVVIDWASWGPTYTRLMPYTVEGVTLGYNVGYEGNQLNFNQLDIARDLHRAKNSTQDPRDQALCLQTIFDRNTATTVLADGTFEEDISTYLPFRWWRVQSPGCQIIPAEDWVYIAK